MRHLFSLLGAAVVAAVVLSPTGVRADDYPTYGSVYYPNSYHGRTAAMPIYTPGYGTTQVAPNGAIHYYYTPGHANYGNERGPTNYTPGFRSYYQAPGSLHYYFGSNSNPNAFYDNRR